MRPIQSPTEQLKHVTAHVVADPFDLSRRAAAIESKLSGDDRLALTVSPTALGREAQSRAGHHRRRTLGLPVPHHPRSAARRPSRPAARWRSSSSRSPGGRRCGRPACSISKDTRRATSTRRTRISTKSSTTRREAIGLYTSPQVRPPDRVLDALASEPKKKIYSAAKDGRQLLGRPLALRRGQVRARRKTGSAIRGSPAEADGYWAHGTRYNLARTYEAQGKNAEAIKLYEADDSPQRDGNRLRARWLKNKPQPAAPASERLERLNAMLAESATAGSSRARRPAGRRHDAGRARCSRSSAG